MGIIYALSCRDTFEFYIGSTIDSLQKRVNKHECKTNTCSSRQIIDRGNYEFKILEENDITDPNELVKREQLWMDEYPDCINKIRAYVSPEEKRILHYERGKQYRELNKDKVKNYQTEYIKLNRDKLLQYKKDHYHKNKDREKEKQYRQYTSSWGGDIRTHNNLLRISIDLFN